MPDFECQRCGECCRRYWIMVLPEEAKGIAKSLHLPLKDFISNYCSLFLEFFPSSGYANAMQINSSMLPSGIYKELQKLLLSVPTHLIVLPCISLKRKGSICVFYGKKDSRCKIHDFKPLPCKLFPFISLEDDLKGKKFSGLYPFCRGLRNSSCKGRNLMRDYYPFVEDYFLEVKDRGFRKVWRHFPKKGIASYKGVELRRITEKEFFECVELCK